MANTAYIYDAIRTPRSKGKKDGSLHEVKPVSLASGLLKELQARHDLDTSKVDDVVMPVGPLAVQDEVSQELTRKASDTHRDMGVLFSKADTRAGVEVCETMISKFNRGGRFHGGGFYTYPKDEPKHIWPKLYDLYHKPEVCLPEQDIKDRILFRQVVESLRCLDEGVLKSVADGNIGSIMGIGAPAWTGGFIQFVNTYGLQRFIDRCAELEATYGERFSLPAMVKEKADAGELFE